MLGFQKHCLTVDSEILFLMWKDEYWLFLCVPTATALKAVYENHMLQKEWKIRENINTSHYVHTVGNKLILSLSFSPFFFPSVLLPTHSSLLLFEPCSPTITRGGFELTAVSFPKPPKCWDPKNKSPCSAVEYFLHWTLKPLRLSDSH